MKVLEGQIYEHVNGYQYKVLCTGKHYVTQGTFEEMVVHQGLHNNEIYIRTMDNFCGQHALGVKRFTLVK